MDNEEYLRMIEHHLSMLTQYGKLYTDSITASITLLEHNLFSDSLVLSDETKEIFASLKNEAQKHRDLIEWSINERKNVLHHEEETLSDE